MRFLLAAVLLIVAVNRTAAWEGTDSGLDATVALVAAFVAFRLLRSYNPPKHHKPLVRVTIRRTGRWFQ